MPNSHLADGWKTQAEIGKALGFSQETMTRELARNTGQRGLIELTSPSGLPL